ncbi:MAG: GNAT family N-acetyltransferase, partial [Paludibacteraceae bacterium]|nr:GNAT family N-acetyltransferase [Paludibacteraceae bacterium]
QLSNTELYEILKARNAVFVVEQQCPYQDIDGLDNKAYHLYLEDSGVIKAYLRIIKKDLTTARLGRIITTERGKGYGLALLNEGVKAAISLYNCETIYIEAQCYAIGFYEKAGFKVCSEPFLDDGIPHVKMELTI